MKKLVDAFERHNAGRYEEAFSLYRSILADDDSNAEAWHLLGLLHKQTDNPAAAIAHITRATELDPGNSTYLANLSNAHIAAGSLSDATAAAIRAFQVAREEEYRGRGAVPDNHVPEGGGSPQRRAELLRDYLFLGGDDIHLLNQLVMLCTGDYPVALLALRRIFLKTRAGSDYERLTTVAAAAGYDKGRAQAFLDEDPTDPLRWLVLGNSLRHGGMHVRAQAAYDKGLALEPGNSLLLAQLGCMLAESGRFEEADRRFLAMDKRYVAMERTLRCSRQFFAELRASPPVYRRVHFIHHAQADGAMLFSGADAGYFEKFAKRLISSALANSPACGVHIHVYNPTERSLRLMELYRRHFGGRVGFSSSALDVAEYGGKESGAYSCERFAILPTVLTHYANNIIFIDIDQIVLKDVSAFAETCCAEGDFALLEVLPFAHNPYQRYYAGFICIAQSAAAHEYFNLVARYIMRMARDGLARWFLDQAALFICHEAGFRGRAKPHKVSLGIDIYHSGNLIENGQEAPIKETALLWSYYASKTDVSLLAQLPTFRKYDVEIEGERAILEG